MAQEPDNNSEDQAEGGEMSDDERAARLAEDRAKKPREDRAKHPGENR